MGFNSGFKGLSKDTPSYEKSILLVFSFNFKVNHDPFKHRFQSVVIRVEAATRKYKRWECYISFNTTRTNRLETFQ